MCPPRGTAGSLLGLLAPTRPLSAKLTEAEEAEKAEGPVKPLLAVEDSKAKKPWLSKGMVASGLDPAPELPPAPDTEAENASEDDPNNPGEAVNEAVLDDAKGWADEEEDDSEESCAIHGEGFHFAVAAVEAGLAAGDAALLILRREPPLRSLAALSGNGGRLKVRGSDP